MDIQKLRQEFEKLPDIKGILYGSEFGFNESLNEYYHPDHTNHRLNYAFIMGAWMAWKTKAQAPEGFVLLPVEPTQAIKTALSYQCFDFIKVAQIYRDHGFDIPKKAENEQSFFLHKFLLLAIKHGDDFIKFFNAETKAMIEAREQSHD